jgi:hypothetical protein
MGERSGREPGSQKPEGGKGRNCRRRDANGSDWDGRGPLEVGNGLREGRYWTVDGKNGCAQLYAFTRIYRLLSLVSGR